MLDTFLAEFLTTEELQGMFSGFRCFVLTGKMKCLVPLLSFFWSGPDSGLLAFLFECIDQRWLSGLADQCPVLTIIVDQTVRVY